MLSALVLLAASAAWLPGTDATSREQCVQQACSCDREGSRRQKKSVQQQPQHRQCCGHPVTKTAAFSSVDTVCAIMDAVAACAQNSPASQEQMQQRREHSATSPTDVQKHHTHQAASLADVGCVSAPGPVACGWWDCAVTQLRCAQRWRCVVHHSLTSINTHVAGVTLHHRGSSTSSSKSSSKWTQLAGHLHVPRGLRPFLLFPGFHQLRQRVALSEMHQQPVCS